MGKAKLWCFVGRQGCNTAPRTPPAAVAATPSSSSDSKVESNFVPVLRPEDLPKGAPLAAAGLPIGH